MLETLMAQLNTMFVSPKEEEEEEEGSYAAPGQVPCDVCPGKRLQATKFCQNCTVFYCDKHLQSHMNIPQYKNHTLKEPRDNMGKKCSLHDQQHTGSDTDTSSTSSETSHSPFSGTGTGPSSGVFIETKSASGANKPTFFGSFGSSSGDLFGSSSPFGTTSSLFGGSMCNTAQKTGVIVNYIPLTDSETIGKDSFTRSFVTKDQCISAMKECEKESPEELHLEDDQAERKGPSNPAAHSTCFIFGSNTVTSSASTGLFNSSAPKTSSSFRQSKTIFSSSTKTSGTSTDTILNTLGQTTSQSTGNSFGKTASISQSKNSMSLLESKTTGSSTTTTRVLDNNTEPTLTDMGTNTSPYAFGTNLGRGDLPENKPAAEGHRTRFGRDGEVAVCEEECGRHEKELEESRRTIRVRVEQKEKELEELRRSAAVLSSSADAALKLSKNTFTEMIELAKERKKSSEQDIRCKDHILRFGIQYLLDYVKEDIAFWEKQKKEREALIFKTHDPFDFMRKYSSLPLIPPPELARLVDPETTAFRKHFVQRQEIPMKVNHLCYFYQTRLDDEEQPKFARDGFLKHWRKITWDVNTAHRNVSLEPTGGGNPCALFSATTPSDVPDHPDCFSDCVQVLSKEPLTGRCYFEVCPTSGCFVGLTYKSIERKGRGSQCVLGLNDKSWACFGGGFKYKGLNNSDTWVLCPDALNRVGVYLNQEAGTLTFFLVRGPSLCEIHAVETQFTEPLYFGVLFLYPGDRIWIPDLKDKPVC